MKTKLIGYQGFDVLKAEEEMSEFFGKRFNMVKAIFTNEPGRAQEQAEEELIVLSTQLSLGDLSHIKGIKKLCLIQIEQAMKVEQWAYEDFKRNDPCLALMKEYGAIPLYTGDMKQIQTITLDKSDPFKYPKIAFIYYREEHPDLKSYEDMGFRFIAIAQKGNSNDDTAV